jgi:hypothetical protein
MGPINAHALAAAPSAKARAKALAAAHALAAAATAAPEAEWLSSKAYADATVALEASLTAEADAYNRRARARAASARGAQGAARRPARGGGKHARDAEPELWIHGGMDPDGQWIGPVVVHGVHGYGAPPTWEQMHGLLSTRDLLGPYRETPHWRRDLQLEEEKRQEDIAKRQGDIKMRWQSLAHRHFWMRNRNRALASSLHNTDSD